MVSRGGAFHQQYDPVQQMQEAQQVEAVVEMMAVQVVVSLAMLEEEVQEEEGLEEELEPRPRPMVTKVELKVLEIQQVLGEE